MELPKYEINSASLSFQLTTNYSKDAIFLTDPRDGSLFVATSDSKVAAFFMMLFVMVLFFTVLMHRSSVASTRRFGSSWR